eukprot:1299371-Prymnesium_polylepis.1
MSPTGRPAVQAERNVDDAHGVGSYPPEPIDRCCMACNVPKTTPADVRRKAGSGPPKTCSASAEGLHGPCSG